MQELTNTQILLRAVYEAVTTRPRFNSEGSVGAQSAYSLNALSFNGSSRPRSNSEDSLGEQSEAPENHARILNTPRSSTASLQTTSMPNDSSTASIDTIKEIH